MKKRVVVVGFGGMGSWHTEYISKSDVVELAGIYDIKEERRQAGRNCGFKAYESLEEVLADPTVDLILIATPNDCHRPIAEQAMAAGKNVISEKPVTLSHEDLQAMIDASKKSGRLFTTHQNRRWDADFLSMKEIYESGKLGPVFRIESRVHGSRGIPGDWRGQKEHGGGMVLDWGVHLIDQMLLMVPGKIKKIYARMDHITNYEVDDGFRLDLMFENGVDAHIEVGTSNFINLPRWYMLGENGSAYLPGWWLNEGEMVVCENFKAADAIPIKTAAGLTKTMAPRTDDSIVKHAIPDEHPDVHDFYRNVCHALDGLEPQLITHEQLMRVMRVMEAAFESDRLCQVIDFE